MRKTQLGTTSKEISWTDLSSSRSFRGSEEESSCVTGRRKYCQLPDLYADCPLLRSCLCSHFSHWPFQRVPFLYFLALARLAWQPSCWQVLGVFGFAFFFVIFVSAGTWIHCGLGDVLHSLTLLYRKKEDIIILIVEESLKVFTELFWVQENWEQTPSSLTSDFLQRSIRDFLPVAVWRCWQ